MNAVTPIAGMARAEAGSSWTARMVRPLADAGVGTRASFVRGTVRLDHVAGDERLRISAQGLYRAFINGRRVGEDLLTPGWTAYDKRLSYQDYIVGDLLVAGENTIDIWLGDGWFRSQMMWGKKALTNTWGEHIAAIAELSSGGTVVLATGEDWRSGLLPVLASGIYLGETHDARLEILAPDQGVAVLDGFDMTTLVVHEAGPVRELEPLAVQKSWTDELNRTVYDFGQNSGGYVAFTVEGEAGAQVLIDHAEILDQNGRFDNTNYRTAEARIAYTLKGGGPESYRPVFTFQGFRFARVTISGRATITAITSVPISSALTRTASFSSGHALVNRLVENTLWSQRANFIEVPTDCPQRDERLGWTGDAQVFAPTACYLHESHAFFVKWLRDVMADQREDGAVPHVVPDPTRLHPEPFPGFYGSTGWGDAICVIPWTLYLHYADTDVLTECLPAMVAWVDFVWSISDGPIVRPPRAWGARGFTFGDWLQPKGPSEKPLPTIGDDAAATIYLHIASKLTAQAATVVGDKAVATRMGERAEAVRQAFAHEFIAPSGRLVYDDQTSYALAIVHDLIPEALLPAAIRCFKATIDRAEGRIGTGFIGTPALLPALLKAGEPELAAAVFLQEGVPGWLYQVRHGATTIWERWDALDPTGKPFDPAMNSYNHYAYGAVCQWLLEAVAGFRPDPERPGFAHIVFEPTVIPALSPVEAHHDTAHGRIEAGWNIEGNAVTYRVAVPQGAEATLVLADRYADARLDGRPVEGRRVPLGAGRHEVTFTLHA